MRKWIKEHKWATLFIFVASVALAAGVQENVPSDSMKIGLGTNSPTDDRQIIFDTGDGAANPKIVIDMTNKDFDFNAALNVAADLFKLGTGAAADQTVEFDIGQGASNPKFRWSNTDQSLQFANDGVNFRNVGSGAGGGGGINFLGDFNSDFEAGDPPNDWVNSGGLTFVAETTTPLIGKQSGRWDADSASDTLDSQLVAINPGFAGAVGQTCTAELLYKWVGGVQGDIQLKIRNQVPEDIVVIDLAPTTGDDTRLVQLVFDCPQLAQSIRMRLESTADAAEITIDNAFIGFGKNTVQVSQTQLWTLANYESTISCSWGRTSAAFGPFSPTAACPAITVNQSETQVDTTDDDLPTLVYQDPLPAGRYVLKAVFTSNSSVAAANTGYRINETNVTEITIAGGQIGHCGKDGTDASDFVQVTCYFPFTLTAPSTAAPRFELEGFNSSGTVIVRSWTDAQNLVWELVRYPLNTAEALTLETAGLSWSGYHNLECTWQVTSAAFTKFAGDTNASCALVDRKTGLSVVSEVDGGGDERPGIVFTSPITQTYNICPSLAFSATPNTLPNINFVDQSSNVLANIGWRSQPNTANIEGWKSVCFLYTATAGVENTIGIEVRNDSGSITLTGLQGGANTISAIEWVVYPIDQQFPTPVFTALQDSLRQRPISEGTSQLRVEYAIANCSGGGCTLSQTSGNWLSSISRTGTGQYTLNHSPTWGSAPACVVTPWVQITGSCSESRITLAQTATTNVETFVSAGTSQDCGFHVVCYGGD